MSKKDQLTNRKPVFGNKRSKALNTSKRRWDLNLQKAKVKLSNNKVATVRISTRTKKTLKKQNRLV